MHVHSIEHTMPDKPTDRPGAGTDHIQFDPPRWLESHVERPLRDGRCLLRLATPTGEGNDLERQVLGKHGVGTVTYFARYTIEGLVPPSTG